MIIHSIQPWHHVYMNLMNYVKYWHTIIWWVCPLWPHLLVSVLTTEHAGVLCLLNILTILVKLIDYVCLTWQCKKLTEPGGGMTWDDALRKSTQEFQHRSYSLFTCNCHSFVANNLNRLMYCGHEGWNVVNIAAFIFLKGTWVRRASLLQTYIPFLVVFGIGVFLGTTKFLLGVLAFTVALIGWFLIGTYCFKNLIQL